MNISLVNNGYEGLLIAIREDVSESEALITRLKEVFTDVSSRLFSATRQRAYLRNVTILVPKSWQKKNDYGEPGIEAFDKANIIIVKSGKNPDHNPYVIQPGHCGEPGQYMHLTKKFLLDDDVASPWGDRGKTIVHEWGHLRWGLFDEYALDDDPKDKPFYLDSGKIEGVRCSLNLFWELNEGCNVSESSGLPEDNCIFIVPTKGQEATASYGSHHYVPTVTDFCDNNTSPSNRHNDRAPNRQNRFCAGRSAWEVMRESDDFKDGRNPPLPKTPVTGTVPHFTVLQQKPRRYVLVLDVSGSMDRQGENGNTRLENLRQACEEYLLHIIAEGDSVGIVEFDTTAVIITSLTNVSSESVLEANGAAAAGGILLVVSDGDENRLPFISDVKPSLIDKKIITDTILFTKDADSQLISLAKDTGGMSFLESQGTLSPALMSAVTKTVTQRSGDQTNTVVQVLSDTLTVAGGGIPLQGAIYVDSTIGKNTSFVFNWKAGLRQIRVVLKTPDNVTNTPEDDDYNFSAGTLRYRINGTAKVGKWLYIVRNTGTEIATVQLQVSSRPSGSGEPIVLTASVSSDVVDLADPASSRIAIYGIVTQGFKAVVGANVVAYIDASGQTNTLQLLDNGAGADNTKNDGIYTAYFLNFGENGAYSIRVVVIGEDGTSLKSVIGGQKAIRLVTNNTSGYTAKPEITYTPIEPFMRSDSGGLFTVINLPTSTPGSEPPDLYPPGSIYDLVLGAVNTENKTVTLSWTATGDDLDQGNASSYDIRYSTSISDIRNNFMESNKFLDDDLLQGKLDSPLPAGGAETFIVQFNQTVDHNVTYFIALVATDDRNQSGQVSNVVSVSFVYVNPFPSADPVTSTEATTEYETTAVDTTTELTTLKSKPLEEDNPFNIIGIIIASVAVVVIIIIAVAIALHIRRKNLLKGYVIQ
ncbi:calcium-activated chloride channel regulator 1-like [Lingula anatina]|uniref:Calcium-activated chloride channel regulator 1-like n=1 Tax=Lingula anatina TaxID=7574 RepID=A0A1S3IU51_LINAN|nr:calcium-activated chloride channel regulator 1-like [Lingula anatina]|eukprot:XP_013401735.1 calcium-activated chloride channel regulator 1-like [Lingula anatina]